MSNYTLKEHGELVKRLVAGEMSATELRLNYQRLKTAIPEVKAELTKLRIKDMIRGNAGNMNKGEIINRYVSAMLSRYTLDKSVSYCLFDGESYESARDKVVESITDEDIQRCAQARKDEGQRLRKVLTNPETDQEYEEFVSRMGEEKLTPEQRVKWDDVQARRTRAARVKERVKIVAKMEAPSTLTLTVKEDFHTRRQCKIWIVQMNQRVERPVFDGLFERAKLLGGWFSSYGGPEKTGFLFLEQANAVQFSTILSQDVDRSEQLKRWEDCNRDERAARLRNLSQETIARAEERMNQDRLDNTHRRATIAAGIESDCRRQIQIAQTLGRLADAMAADNLVHLQNVYARTHIECLDMILKQAMWEGQRVLKTNEDREPAASDALYAKFPYPVVSVSTLLHIYTTWGNKDGLRLISRRFHEQVKNAQNDWYECKRDSQIEDLMTLIERLKSFDKRTSEYLVDRLETWKRLWAMDIYTLPELRAALREYCLYRVDRPQADPIKEALRGLVGTNIPGYFPTPPAVIDLMLDTAMIEPGDRILEPSAGAGHIADAIRERYPENDLYCFEISQTLLKILLMKKHNAIGNDFLIQPEQMQFKRILMNPPFEDGQDILHVQHAYKMLAPGGRLVAIMSEGPFFWDNQKGNDFRLWLQSVGGTSEKLPEGSFLESDRATGVNTRIVTIEKP